MNTTETNTKITTDVQTDHAAVLAHFLTGQPLDPAIAERVRARASRITEELRQQCGEMNIAVDLIRETRDEA